MRNYELIELNEKVLWLFAIFIIVTEKYNNEYYRELANFLYIFIAI